MKKIINFIEAHNLSKCKGSYRKGVILENDKICRMFINFTTSKMDKHSEDYNVIFYAGRGKKDKDKYFVENTNLNKENLRMKGNKNPFPIYIRNKEGYFYLGMFSIEKSKNKIQYNPILNKKFSTIGFICKKN